MAPAKSRHCTYALFDFCWCCCRLAHQPVGYAAVTDEAGLLRYLKVDSKAFRTDSVYQLQYGHELVYQNQEPVEVPCMVDRPWTSFEFLPHRARSILFHQSGSNKLLYTTLPDAISHSSPVLLFGSHTGRLSIPQPGSSLNERYIMQLQWLHFSTPGPQTDSLCLAQAAT